MIHIINLKAIDFQCFVLLLRYYSFNIAFNIYIYYIYTFTSILKLV